MSDPRDEKLKPVDSIKPKTPAVVQDGGGGTGGSGGTNPPGAPGKEDPGRPNNTVGSPVVSPVHPDQVHGLTPPPVSPTHPDQVHGLVPPEHGDPFSPEDGVNLTEEGQALAAVQNFNVQGDPEEVEKLQDGLAVLSTLDNEDAQTMLQAFEERGTVITFGDTHGAGALYKPLSLNPLNRGADIVIVNEEYRDRPPEEIAGYIALEGVHALQNNGDFGDRAVTQAEYGYAAGDKILTGESPIITGAETDMVLRGVPILQEIRDKTGVANPVLAELEPLVAQGPEYVENLIKENYPAVAQVYWNSFVQAIQNTDPGVFPEVNSAP
ncbi:MAG: hypothetical protein HYU64_10840 [Armatimonadetes bacterium]|nr:hypothetical protein [Armatimonadota bacterium]